MLRNYDMLMNAKTKMAAKLDEELPISFDIQVCSNDGRIRSEYTLTRKDDQVTTLKSAEHHVRVGLSGYKGEEPLVVFISQETLTKFRQVQIKVVAKEPCSS